ncbi:MAG: cell division protein FtsA [Chloroflexi bacterium RBG_19FT_COMBO_62_14]|nr:MAG: cell division protein FtsA [Chloroflexi bacterium RBG_19FT_COMBO_62_14]
MAGIIGTDQPIFVGLDIGTSKVCALVGHLDEDRRLRVIGVGLAQAQGMRKGGVVNLEGVAKAVEAAKDKAERTSGYEISSALVSLSGGQVASLNSKGMSGVSGRTIGQDDIARALEAARSIAVPYNRQIVHVIPRGYVIDGQDGIKSPIGMHGYRLEVEAHVVTAPATGLRNLEKAVEAAGVAIDGWVLGPLAAGEVVLTETEREMGVLVCDIGAGTCDIAIYIEGAVWHTAVVPVGGDHLTSDIAQGLHLPLETAESVKIRHGRAQADASDDGQAFAVRPFGAEKSIEIRRAELARIVEPRVEEIFGLVRQEIKRSGYDGLLPAGMVLTGGTSLLPGIRETASSVLRLPVRLAAPGELRGLVDQLRSPSFSASVGLLHWARMMEEQSVIDGRGVLGLSWRQLDLGRAADFFRRLLPG